MANGFEGVAVDMVHVVMDGVPCGTERTLLAVGIEGDDVDSGNISLFVDRDMVIGDLAAPLHGEVVAVASGARC